MTARKIRRGSYGGILTAKTVGELCGISTSRARRLLKKQLKLQDGVLLLPDIGQLIVETRLKVTDEFTKEVESYLPGSSGTDRLL